MAMAPPGPDPEMLKSFCRFTADTRRLLILHFGEDDALDEAECLRNALLWAWQHLLDSATALLDGSLVHVLDVCTTIKYTCPHQYPTLRVVTGLPPRGPSYLRDPLTQFTKNDFKAALACVRVLEDMPGSFLTLSWSGVSKWFPNFALEVLAEDAQ